METIDRQQDEKGEFYLAAKVPESARRQLNHDKPVTLNVLMNICKVFHCNIGDVVDFIEDE